MPRTTLNIAGGYYKDESYAISNRECVNFYPHIPEGQTITDGCLIGIGGIEAHASGAFDFDSDICRGGHSFQDSAYFVADESLYRVTSVSIVGPLGGGTIGPGNDIDYPLSRVIMADNGVELCIVVTNSSDPNNAYIYNPDTVSLVPITDVNFDGPVSSVCFSDGYFIFSKRLTNKWFISNLRDGLNYDALDFGSAESDPDYIVAVAALRGIVYVFGTQTFEQYQNVGGSGFPYERINSGTYNKGCLSAATVIEVGSALYWLGASENENPAIWATKGGEPQKISTNSIDFILGSVGPDDIARSWAMKWAEDGHSFISFTIPGVTTVVYDLTTGLWHERKSINNEYTEIHWRPAAIVRYNSVINESFFIVGDSVSNKVGRYTKDAFDEYGEEIRGYFTPPPFDNGGRPFSVNAVELVMQTGDVPISGQGSDPVIRMSVSKNGGKTYSPEISRKVGQIGDYTKRIAWSPLGRFPRSCTLRFDISEPIKRVIVKAEVEIGR